MIQRMVDGDVVLAEVTRVLVERFDPDRIILFGSRARGDAREDSDYDVVVELDAEESPELSSQARSAIRAANDADVDVHFRQPGAIEARRDDPGHLDWDIARDGVVIYAAKRPVRQVRERPAPISSVNELLEAARIDLLTIEILLQAKGEIPWPAVCFHAQQAAEKYLKVAIIRTGVRPTRTHDLAALIRQLRAGGMELPDLAQECQLLEPFAVDARYITLPAPESGERAVSAMRKIIAAVSP